MLPIIKARSQGRRNSKRALHIYDGQRCLWRERNVIDASDPTSGVGNPETATEEGSPAELNPGEATTTSTAGKASDINENGVETPANGKRCTICNREFPLRKTMLRHLRTVHAPKDLRCPTCNKSFIRQDNLTRHIAEQHGSDDHFVKCDLCGRRVSKRGLSEHTASRVCKASREQTKDERSNEIAHLCVEDEDDCFLLTMRVLKLWLPLATKQIQCASVGGEALSQDVTSSEAYSECISLGARALDSMRSQMQDNSTVTKDLRLFSTAVLWACISLIGVEGVEHAPTGFQDWTAHLKGASVLLKVFHQSTCDCDKYLLCQELQQRANQDPALCLLNEIVKDAGLIGILLNVLPSLVRTWERSLQLLDVLLKCTVSQIGQRGDDMANWQSFCESHGIVSDNDLSRGLEAMIWAMLRVSVKDGP